MNKVKNNYIAITVIILFLLVGLFFVSNTLRSKVTTNLPSPPSTQVAQAPTVSPQQVLGIQTKTSGCKVDGALPDSACTPGAVFPNVTKEQICTMGYASSVRNVSTAEKDQVYEEYGLPIKHEPGSYEVDHLISLELGGSNDISNLWPEAAEPRPGFHEKDQVENYLHDQVCNGAISLQQAQQQISQNWLAIYNQIK